MYGMIIFIVAATLFFALMASLGIWIYRGGSE
jgi:hypothetical protein